MRRNGHTSTSLADSAVSSSRRLMTRARRKGSARAEFDARTSSR